MQRSDIDTSVPTDPTAPTEAPTSPASTHVPLGYRPALDGLRAVAVYLVVAFHAGSARLSGGFIGVDIFFVLSGYLVTRLILDDLANSSFSMITFYGRRIRRLLPAALVTLVAVATTWLVIASPLDRAAIVGDARSAALFFSNWHFAAQATDYFAANENPTPLLHFWSLSVEEQFYFVWPLTMLALWRLSTRARRDAARVIGAVAIVGSILSLVALVATVRNGDTSLAYYGTHTRVYQLLGGALLAVIVHRGRMLGGLRRSAALAQPILLVGLLVLATNRVTWSATTRGIAAAALTIALLATLEARPTGPVAQGLGVGVFTSCGKISYGTYLWHYPVIIVVSRFATMSPYLLAIVTSVLATSMAALSSRLLEMPIRQSVSLARRARPVIAVGLTASLIAGLVLLPALLRTDRRPIISAKFSQAPAADAGARVSNRIPGVSTIGLDLDAMSEIPPDSPSAGPALADRSCTTVPVDQCILTRGSGPKVLLIGDSHAGMLAPAFRAIGKAYDLTVAVASGTGCPWHQSLYFTKSDPGCDDTQDVWYHEVIPEFDPDIIIFASRATDHVIGSSYGVASNNPDLPTDVSSMLVAAAQLTFESVTRPGRSIVLVEPVPVSADNTKSCLSAVLLTSDCSFVTEGASAAELGYRALENTVDGLTVVDIDALVCPDLPICDPVIDGILVRSDHDHITKAWSAHIAANLGALLHRLGVI